MPTFYSYFKESSSGKYHYKNAKSLMKILIMMIIIIVAVVRFHQETFKVTKYPQLKDLP